MTSCGLTKMHFENGEPEIFMMWLTVSKISAREAEMPFPEESEFLMLGLSFTKSEKAPEHLWAIFPIW